jgi:outer membrane receptor protein involved in Fe transport
MPRPTQFIEPIPVPGRSGALFSGAAILCGVLQVAGSAAQTVQPNGPSSGPNASSSSADLAEVVVTAERRVGTVQSTPISITAYSGAQLEAQGITDVNEIGYETPGVSEKNSGPGQTEYEMRGISSSGGTSPTVGFYLDDVPLTAPAQALNGKVVIDPSLYDLNRVEVLRGPQGTLYGSGSMGGTIKLISNQPDPKAFAASGQVTGSGTEGGGGNYAVNAMVNVPLVDNVLALRVVGTDTYTSGWIDREVLNPFPLPTQGGFSRGNVLAAPVQADHSDANWERLQGVRAAVLWQPTDELTVTPSVFYQQITQGAPNFVDVPPGIDNETHYQPFDVAEPYSDTFQLYTLPIKYDVGGIEITSTAAYYDRRTSINQDSSEVGQDFLTALIGVPGVSYADAGPLTAYETDHTEQFSEELRLSSTGQGPLRWVLGGIYQNYDAHTAIGTTTPGPIVAELFGTPSYFDLTFKNVLKQYAGFGEASYQLGPFRATAGLRYYSYSTVENLTEGGGLISGPAPPFTYALSSSASGVNPKYNFAYEPNKDLTLYVQAAKGFRPGGANTPAPITCPNNPIQYGSDGLWSYETGEKARFLDNRVIINAAAYFENWSQIQQLITEACGSTYTANAGTAHVYGGELEATVRLTEELTISTAAGYTHAQLASVEAGSGFTVGERVQDVPDYTDTTSLSYTRPVTAAYDMVLRASNVYVGTSTDPSFQLNRIPVRNIGSLRAGLVGKNDLSVYLFVDNVTNKHAYLGDPEELFAFVPAINRVATNQPRTIGVQLSYGVGGR